MLRTQCLLGALVLLVSLGPGCDGETEHDGGYNENAGHPCTSPANCYPGLDAGALSGDVVCLDRVPNGYCTHLCQDDTDCCAVPGECETGHPQVCAPFESAPEKYCLLSCEDQWLGGLDSSGYCQRYADSAFGCRSTGGGSENRKVCMP